MPPRKRAKVTPPVPALESTPLLEPLNCQLLAPYVYGEQMNCNQDGRKAVRLLLLILRSTQLMSDDVAGVCLIYFLQVLSAILILILRKAFRLGTRAAALATH